MSILIFFLGAFGMVASAPQFPTRQTPQPVAQGGQAVARDFGAVEQAYPRILRLDQDVLHDGTFSYAYETENGISGQANGQLKNAGTPEEAQVIQGSYSYTAPDGTPVSITYIADEGGFRAEGSHIPTAPPVPEAIQRALDYIRSLPPSRDEPQY